jgi:uncharacterized protein
MRWIGRLAISVLLALMIGSALLAEFAVHLPEHPASKLEAETLDARQFARGPGATSRFVQIHAAGVVTLSGWLFSPAQPNNAAVILLHGIGDTWTGVLGQAEFLLKAGYTVLAPDSRAHGRSGGKLVTYGLLEKDDIHRWAGLLFQQPGIERLYGAGQSMGASILIQSLAVEPRFRGIVADCPFATFEEIAFDRLKQNGIRSRILSWPILRVGLLYDRVRYGLDLRSASPAAVLRSATTPVLLIHGSADSNIPIRHSRELHAINPKFTELWEVPGAEHVQCVSYAPDAYARRVTAFFAAHL